ncbi:MAG TPA: Calx-beta domain-containing protein [Nocardioidaceae bacterium]|nr:Calx-beta domain-containing protein [Nocardioidaceae bacterium]
MQRATRRGFLAAVTTAAASLGLTLLAAPVAGGEAALSNLAVTTHDLGSLGGRWGRAEAVSGSVVVGQAGTASGDYHAFAYDLAADEPVIRDLGTLGGKLSSATDVDGSIVVGWAETASGRHAFAYDLAADEPVMRDLGTLGGHNSEAVAVEGGVVVGWAETEPSGRRAFAYDLADDEPVMQDLGTLGGPYSAASAVDGDVVVGTASTASDPTDWKGHAFAYDLGAAEPAMTDLGTLGGRYSGASAVDGNLVVGWSGAKGRHAFVYDLQAPEPAMRNLGTLDGDTTSEAAAVDRGVVVGTSFVAGSLPKTAFAVDLRTPQAEMQDFSTLGDVRSWARDVSADIVIGDWLREWGNPSAYHAFAHDLGGHQPRSLVLGGWRGSWATDIDGDVVVGSTIVDGAGTQRPTAWVLQETGQPLFAFHRSEHQVKEGVGRAAIRVERYGSTDRGVTVRYRTRSASATAGKDFVSTSGELRFAAGVTSRSFTLKVLNDRRAEKNEDLVLTLSRPSAPAQLGSPSWTEIRITKNDR